MTITTTPIEDTPDHTTTLVVDDVLRSQTIIVVYKSGSPSFNQQALTTRLINAIADCDTAEGLINTSGWDGLSAAQRKAIMLGVIQDIRAAARLILGQPSAPS